jgi:Domain of unknown function DUF29
MVQRRVKSVLMLLMQPFKAAIVPSMQSLNIASQSNAEIRSLLYDRDFYAWTQQQATLIRDGRWDEIDCANLLEEIESLGKQQRQELRNRLGVLIGHLLKWQYQPQNRSRSWLSTIRLQRLEIVDLLDDNPSLKPYLDDAIDRAYLKGLAIAIDETNLPDRIFPQTCEYSLENILDDHFYPGDPDQILGE